MPTSALVTAVRLHPFWCSSPLQRGDARLAAVAHVSHGGTGQALRWHLAGDGMDERQDPAARQGRRKGGAARQGEELATAAGTHGARRPDPGADGGRTGLTCTRPQSPPASGAEFRAQSQHH